MNLKKVQIELDISDVQQVLGIALDEDKDKALEYIKGSLSKRSRKSCSRIECRFSRPVTALHKQNGLVDECSRLLQ